MKQKLIRLPDALAAIVLDVINERLAGGEGDFRDALGLTDRQAAARFRQLEDAAALIRDGKEIESREAVVCVFTRAEALNLHRAADNSAGTPTDARERRDLLGSDSAVAACQRGMSKLSRARVAVENLKLQRKPEEAPSRALRLSIEDEEAALELRFAGVKPSAPGEGVT